MKNRLLSKSFLTNALSLLLIGGGYFSPFYPSLIKSVGFFAFSGAITNWLAVYMLFEKIPGLYGSGVVPNNFEKFKAGIRFMIMEQFFTPTNIERLLKEGQKSISGNSLDPQKLTPLLHSLFDGLVETALHSPLGGMLAMFGGPAVLESMRAPAIAKMSERINEKLADLPLIDAKESTHQLTKTIDHLLHQRLEELTPKMVKEIVERMIREHLGWLVVWGGVFGGLIGLIMGLISP